MTRESNDEKSRDVSSAILADKLKHKGFNVKQEWGSKRGFGNDMLSVAVHDFLMEGSRFLYQLKVQQDQSITAYRVNPDDPYATPRTMSPDFAKLLYMKVWPNVGV